MTSERYEQVKAALGEALALDGADRTAYLARLLERDQALHDEVSQLLTYSRRADDFLEDPVVPREALAAGSSFGGYEIESALGRGGMGQVYLARERTLDRPVALKFLAPELQAREDARHRFLREARAAAALDHPYVCKIFQTGEEDGRPFIAMEYIRGETLKDRLTRERLGLDETLQIVLKIAEALEAAHAAHIVHRDLKPSNVMLTPGEHVKVLDFGLAKRVGPNDADASAVTMATQVGTVQGTIAYMSPEQLRGEEVDARSDIFSLGILLYEMAAGAHPFRGEIPADTPGLILRHTPPPLSAKVEAAPPGLDQIVGRMLAKDRNDRYQSVTELRADLRRLTDPSQPTRTLAPALSPVARPAWLDRRTLVMALLVVGVLLGAVGLWQILSGEPGPPTLAIMRFANESNDPTYDYLANGIPDTMTSWLNRAGMVVTPFANARRFSSDDDPQEVGRALDADAVLTARLRSDGFDIVVSAELIPVGSSGVMWSDRFEAPIDSGLAEIQTRLVEKLFEALGQQLSSEGEALLARLGASSSDALDLYYQGAALVLEGTQESIDNAEGWFRAALEADPNLVEAHVGLGTVYYEQFWNGWGTIDDLSRAAEEYRRALTDDDGDMRSLRGQVLVEFARGNGEAILRLARQAAARDSDDVERQLAIAQALHLRGVGGDADVLLHRVVEQSPSNQAAAYSLALNAAYTDAGTFAAPDAYIEQFGDDPFVTMVSAFMHEKAGQNGVARDLYDRSIRRVDQAPLETAAADWYELSALLYAGAYYERAGQQDRATEIWQKGARLAEMALQDNLDNFKAIMLLAAFQAFLGDADAFGEQAARAEAMLDGPGLREPWDIMYLAAAYTRIGNLAHALELLQDQKDDILVGTQHLWALFGPKVWTTPGFVELRNSIEASRSALRAQTAALLSP